MTDVREMLITIVGKYYGALTQTAIEDITDAILAAGFRLVTPPGKDVVEGARAVVRQHICEGSFEEMQDDLAHSIAAFATACVAKETERHRAEVGKMWSASEEHRRDARHWEEKADTLSRNLAAEQRESSKLRAEVERLTRERDRARQWNRLYDRNPNETQKKAIALRAANWEMGCCCQFDENDEQIIWCSPHADLKQRAEAAESALVAMTRERDEARTHWRCFHCGECFTDRALAAAHFGIQIDDVADEPACKLNEAEGGLAVLLREAQAELRKYHEEDERADAAESALAAAQKRVGELESAIDEWRGTLTEELALFELTVCAVANNPPPSLVDQSAKRAWAASELVRIAALKEPGNGDETVRPDQQGEKR